LGIVLVSSPGLLPQLTSNLLCVSFWVLGHAAIIHVDLERVIKDEEKKEHQILNNNVLIEIGAAMALYGRRFILLVQEGVTLPSNLQGLYEVRYSGEKLDSDVTLRLLDAIQDIQNHPLPDRYKDQ
jgi:predicted nucleotide-binding protein